MKKYLLFGLATVFTSMSLAWTATSTKEKQYTFNFKMKDGSFKYEGTAPSYEEAFEVAAQACFKYFKAGRHVSEDRGLDIIDACANPKSL